MCDDLFQRALEPTKRCLADAKLSPKDIDEVVLVGGATRVPKLQQLVKDFFGKEPNRTVNPDEVVAIGAAVQAGVLSGEVKDILLLDVTPLSLGVETLGGVMTRLIERNTTIPARKSEVFSTAGDNQTMVEINVLQGEREFARDNRSLGRFHLEGIPPAPRGVPQVEVTFDIDANGILHVSAKDRATNKEQKITISHNSGLDKSEVEKMVADAKTHETEDKAKREVAELRNRAEQLSYQTEKMVKENKDKLSEATVKQMEEAVAEVNRVKGSETLSEIQAAMEKLEKASHAAAAELYKAASPAEGAPDMGGAAGAGPSQEAKNEDKAKEDVVDAEFRPS
jgi:molecular chaperone DnaK